MDKIALEFKTPDLVRIIYKGTEIQVFPFFSIAQQGFLINSYLREYLSPKEDRIIELSKYNYLEAEFSLISHIYNLNTNIETKNISLDVIADVELWEVIKKSIINYNDFREKLDYILKEVKDEIALGMSLGSIVDSLSEKAFNILNSFSEISPEAIDKAREAGLQMIEKLEATAILKDEKPVKRGRKKAE